MDKVTIIPAKHVCLVRPIEETETELASGLIMQEWDIEDKRPFWSEVIEDRTRHHLPSGAHVLTIRQAGQKVTRSELLLIDEQSMLVSRA
jgi:hypothetical protein